MSKIIVIDGQDGIGKSTQFNILKDKLESAGYKVHAVHFPAYENDSSYFVRKFLNGEIENPNPYAVAMMYSLDRYLYLNSQPELKKIMNNTKSDDIILCDRYTTTTFLYQIAMLQAKEKYTGAEGINMANFIHNIDHILLEIPKPDLVVLLTADPNTTIKLAKKRSKDSDIELDVLESDLKLQNRLHENISWIMQYYSSVEINCNSLEYPERLAYVDDIHSLILEELRDKLFIEV